MSTVENPNPSPTKGSTKSASKATTKGTRAADYELERVAIRCVVQTRSDLRVGSGFSDRPELRDATGEPAAGAVMTLCRDVAGAPYIPASTLRGFLRRRTEELDGVDSATIERLFGSARAETDAATGAQSGGPGALRVYDARLDTSTNPGVAVDTRTRIAIDPITGTVSNRFLFTEECIPENTGFHCHFELDRLDEADLEVFVETLQAIDGGPNSGLGAGRSRLGGLLALSGAILVRTLSRDDYRRWLHRDRPLELYFQEDLRAPRTAAPAEGSGAEGDGLRLVLHIRPISPLLVSAAEPQIEEGQQVRVFQTRNGRILVPASGLKGMLRAQSRRILLTMLAERAGSAETPDPEPPDLDVLRGIAEAMTGEVFGNRDAMARLWVSDAVGGDAEQDRHPQHFNAIDRFTGGVADQRLYKVRASTPKVLPFTLLLRKGLLDADPPERPWALGLLLHLLRDALEGDLGIGWGRSRGYGQIQIVQAEADPGDDLPMPSWPLARRATLDLLQTHPCVGADPREWLDALEQRIQSRLVRLTAQSKEEQSE